MTRRDDEKPMHVHDPDVRRAAGVVDLREWSSARRTKVAQAASDKMQVHVSCTVAKVTVDFGEFELEMPPESAEKLGRALSMGALKVRRAIHAGAGGCLVCWAAKGQCRCPKPAAIHHPKGCAHGQRLAVRWEERWQRNRNHVTTITNTEGTRTGTMPRDYYRPQGLTEKIPEVTCKLCVKLPKSV